MKTRAPFRRRAVVGMLSVAIPGLVGLSACGTQSASQAAAGNGAPGLTDSTITLADFIDQSGPFSATDAQVNAGVQLFWKGQNEDGGVCGRQVELKTYNHKYDPQTAVSLYPTIESDAFALESTASPVLSAIGAKLDADGMPAVQLGWSPSVAKIGEVFVAGTYYDIEGVDTIDYLLKTGVVKAGDTVGHVYLQGDYGEPAFKGTSFAAQRNNLKIVGQPVDPTVVDLTSQVRALKDAGAKAVIVTAGPQQLAGFLAASSGAGWNVPVVAASPGFSADEFKTNAGTALANRVIISSPLASYNDDVPGVQKLRSLAQEQGNVTPDLWLVLGYAGGAIMNEALKSACADGDLTRASLTKAFATLKTFDTGGALLPLTPSPDKGSPSQAINFLKPEEDQPGGLVTKEHAFVGEDVAAYKSAE